MAKTAKTAKTTMAARHVIPADLASIERRLQELEQAERKTVLEKGMLLKHVKDNDLTRGQWLNWLESVGIEPRTAQRYIQAYEQFGNTTCASHLTAGLMFDLLALPPEIDRETFVTTPQTIPTTGEKKLVTEMTQKERREVVRAAREAAGLMKPKKRVIEDAEIPTGADSPVGKAEGDEIDPHFEQLFDILLELEETEPDELRLGMEGEGWYNLNGLPTIRRLAELPRTLLHELETGKLPIESAVKIAKNLTRFELRNMEAIPAGWREAYLDNAIEFCKIASCPAIMPEIITFFDAAMQKALDTHDERLIDIARSFHRDMYITRRDENEQREYIRHYFSIIEGGSASVTD